MWSSAPGRALHTLSITRIRPNTLRRILLSSNGEEYRALHSSRDPDRRPEAPPFRSLRSEDSARRGTDERLGKYTAVTLAWHVVGPKYWHTGMPRCCKQNITVSGRHAHASRSVRLQSSPAVGVPAAHWLLLRRAGRHCHCGAQAAGEVEHSLAGVGVTRRLEVVHAVVLHHAPDVAALGPCLPLLLVPGATRISLGG